MTRDTGQKHIFITIQSPENNAKHKRAMERPTLGNYGAQALAYWASL